MPPPVHGDERAAHHRVEVFLAVRAVQKRHVLVELPLGDERRAEALDRHVGERVEAVEGNAVMLAEDAAVVRLQRALRRWQPRSLRVVDEVQHQTAARARVAEPVQARQGREAAREHALAALPVDVVLQVARQRGDDLHRLRGKELGQALLPGLVQHGQVAPVDDVHAERARAQDELPEMRIELRRPAREVQALDARDLEKGEHVGDGLARHRLGAMRAGVHVAVHAALVAAVAEIDLQRLQAPAPERRKAVVAHQRKRGVHAVPSCRSPGCPDQSPRQARNLRRYARTALPDARTATESSAPGARARRAAPGGARSCAAGAATA